MTKYATLNNEQNPYVQTFGNTLINQLGGLNEEGKFNNRSITISEKLGVTAEDVNGFRKHIFIAPSSKNAFGRQLKLTIHEGEKKTLLTCRSSTFLATLKNLGLTLIQPRSVSF